MGLPLTCQRQLQLFLECLPVVVQLDLPAVVLLLMLYYLAPVISLFLAELQSLEQTQLG